MNTPSSPHFPHLYSVLQQALPGKFQRRRGKLNPARVLGLLCVMCTLGQKGYRRVISEMRSGLRVAFGWVCDEDVPTPQAFGQARHALTLDLCREAFDAVRDACTLSRDRRKFGYRGMRIVAIDATRLPLPVDQRLIDHFGCPSNNRGISAAPMAGLVQLWDVGANQPVAFSLTRCDFSERDEALDLFRNLNATDLLIGDRGYPCFRIFSDLLQRGVHFILRCSVTFNAQVEEFVSSPAQDKVVNLTPPRTLKGAEEISLRLLKVTLPSGKIEVLATDLMLPEGHGCEELAALYVQRWRIETAFREMKAWHAVESFSARFPEGIEQELMALQIFLLLAGELEARAYEDLDQRRQSAKTDEELEDLREVRFNRLLIADAAVRLTRQSIDDLDSIPQRVESELRYIWKQRSKRRPGRRYPRKKKSAPKGFKPKGA